MRRRRQVEAERGPSCVRGTLAQVFADAAAAKVPADEIRALLERLRVRPVITAHPTEAKRVTVLEKHRRIYRRLVDLESPRWTPRERQGAGRRPAQRDRAPVADRRAAPAEADGAPGGFLGTALLQRDAVRGGAGPDGEARARSRPSLPGRAVGRPPVLPVRLVDWRRPRRQPLRHQRRHPWHAAGEPADGPPPVSPADRGAGARAQHHGAGRAPVGPLPLGARAGARRHGAR